MVLVLSIINGWSACLVEFVLEFPLVKIEIYIYMDIPKKIANKGGIRKMHILKILNNLYIQRQGYQVWNQKLTIGL